MVPKEPRTLLSPDLHAFYFLQAHFSTRWYNPFDFLWSLKKSIFIIIKKQKQCAMCHKTPADGILVQPPAPNRNKICTRCNQSMTTGFQVHGIITSFINSDIFLRKPQTTISTNLCRCPLFRARLSCLLSRATATYRRPRVKSDSKENRIKRFLRYPFQSNLG